METTTNVEIYEHEKIRNISLATVTAIIGILGLALNSLSAVVMMRLPIFRNPFGLLMAFHSMSNACLLAIFLFWVTPSMLFRLFNGWQTTGIVIGQLAILFQTLSYHTILFIAINRFTAIAFPTVYRSYFTIRNTYFVIAFIATISIAYSSVYFEDDCDFYFDDNTLIWIFADTKCGAILSFYVDLCYNVTLFGVVATFDMITLWKIRKAQRKSKLFALHVQSDATVARRRRDVLFFVQAFTNTLIYCFMLICFHVLSNAVHGVYTILFTTTAWELAHAAGGMIVVAFNGEIRRYLMEAWRTDPATTTAWSNR
ncbi:hypothetical protein V3C99_012919 [Haemonchus contortus]